MIYVLFASLSMPADLMSHQGFLYRPLGFQLEGYKMVFKNPLVISGYLNSIFIVVVGVALNMFLTLLGAYFLSRKGVGLRNVIMVFIVFTMYFNGGLIPIYLNIKDLGLRNSLFSVIFPAAVSTFNMMIMRTAFITIPDSMEESARIDGARHWTILFRIMTPLAKSTVAVLILYYGVQHWNSWFNASLFITSRKLYPLQLILREILIQNQTLDMAAGINNSEQDAVGEVIKYGVIIVATVPILAIYPFLQKYFTKGVMIGALKE